MIIALSGPSGVGKSTLASGLLARFASLALSISHTTRNPRGAERDGVEYYFVSDSEFARMVDEGGFAEHAAIFQHRYGTARSTLAALASAGRDALLDIDYQGVIQLTRSYPDAVSVLLVPPSMAVLEQRLRGRRTDSPEQLQIRLAKARLEMSQYRSFRYVVVNDSFDQALERLSAIYRAEQLLVLRNVAWLESMLKVQEKT